MKFFFLCLFLIFLTQFKASKLMGVGEGARRENWRGGGELENLSSEAKSGLNREGGGGLNGTFMVN